MAKKKKNGRNGYQGINQRTIEAAGHFAKFASCHLSLFYQAEEVDVWKIDLTVGNAMVAVPVGKESHVLTAPDTGITYSLSSYATGLVCSTVAWTGLLLANRGTSHERWFRASQCALFDQIEAHPERASMLALLGQE